MKFRIAEEIDAPCAFVFERMTDFSRVEAEMRGRGVELRRTGGWQTAAEGVAWTGSVKVRGQRRDITATLDKLEAPATIAVAATIGGMETTYQTRLLPLGETKTEASVELDLKPRSLSARLVVQTMKIARGRVLHRLSEEMARRSNEIEAEWRARQGR